MHNFYLRLRLHVSTTLLCFFMYNVVIAQSELPCGNLEAIDVSEFELDRIEQPCFDLEEIIGYCIPVYLRVNFHLFVNDDCTGAFDPNHITSALPQEAAFYEATQPGNRGIPERMIYEMNQRLINNQPQKLDNGEYAESAPCVPLRFVLGNVKIHCNYAYRDAGNFGNFFTSAEAAFGQQEKDGINVYYVKPDGDYSGAAHPSTSGVLIGYPDAGLTLHEIGHALNLNHSFPESAVDCPDEMPDGGEGVNWDKNCDGDIADYQEADWPCGELLPSINGWCTGENLACPDPKPAPPPVFGSPCCDPNNVYNNVMGYNPSKNALTACQVEIMLDFLNTNGLVSCDYIVQIGGSCPPPAPVLSIIPLELSVEDCSFCLQGSASMNDDHHKLEVYELINNSYTLVQSTSWIQGPAGKFCLPALGAQVYGVSPLKSETQYKAILYVKNGCDAVENAELEFSTPDFNCQPPQQGPRVKLVPNPATGGTVTAELSLPGKSPVWLTSTYLGGGGGSNLLYQSSEQNDGDTFVNFDVTSWPTGIHSISFISSYGVVNESFVKQ